MAEGGGERIIIEPEPTLVRSGEELEKKLEKIESRISEVAGKLGGLDGRIRGVEALVELASVMGAWKMETCSYQERGVCKLWRLKREAAGKLKGVETIEENGVLRIKVASSPWACALCPLYKARAAGRSITEKI